MNWLRSVAICLAAGVLAACATETVEQRVLRDTARSLLEQFAYDGYPSSFPEIAARLRREAEAGNVRSQTRLAELYLYGFGVPRDESERVRWHRRAAEGGSALSQYFLAWNYLAGEAVEQDYRQAIEWLRRSAAQGFGEYRDGGSARVQYDCLRPKLQKSRIDTDSESMADAATQFSSLRSFENLGAEFHLGSGVMEWRHSCKVGNNRAALSNFFRAANDGSAKAQYLIGVAYLSGRGTPANHARAAHWFLRAARQNHGPARREYCALYRGRITSRADVPPSSDWCKGISEP